VVQQYQGALNRIELIQSQIKKGNRSQQWATRWAWVATGVSLFCVLAAALLVATQLTRM